jgi:N-acetylmuramoyl-L-alanine amidase
MNKPPVRDKQTREMIQRLQAKRRRRRRMRLLLACLGGLALVALVTTVVVLATQGGVTRTLAGSTTASSSNGVIASATTAAAPATSPSGTETTADTIPTSEDTDTTVASTTTSAPAPSTTTTDEATTTSTPSTTPTTVRQSGGLVVVIDPGHQAKANSSLEPVGPGSSQEKAKVSSGTAGVVTGTPESELVLAVGLKLRDSLAARGIKVVMTRTTQDVDISNIERAQIANEARADLFVRVHADGNSNSATNGIHVLYPVSIAGWTDDIAVASKRAAALAQNELIAATGAKDRGIDARDDMTGFNWSDVPVMLPEIGFMTNPSEDKLLATDAYQDKIVDALTRAILTFLGVS